MATCRYLWIVLLGIPMGSARAESRTLDRDAVIRMGRDAAPTVRVARTRIVEAKGRLAGARVFSGENPVVEGLIGPRWAGSRTTDVEVSLAFPIELGGRRGKRIDVAEAEIGREELATEDTRRLSSGDALAAWYRVLYAERRLALAEERHKLAEEAHRTAIERRKAGDVAQFEVNLAESEVSRAESEVASGKGLVARARADLAAVLGLASGAAFDVEGDLADRTLFDTIPRDVTGADRPDVGVARAGLAVTAAEIALADAERWPDLAVRVTYAREEDADLLLGGISVSLPLFERGQGVRAEARARRQRAAIELEALNAAVSSQLEGARNAYAAAVEAARPLDDKGLPRAAENEAMAREAYRAGKLDLAALLIIRRDALDTRREHLDRLLEAAIAGVDLWIAAGAPVPSQQQGDASP